MPLHSENRLGASDDGFYDAIRRKGDGKKRLCHMCKRLMVETVDLVFAACSKRRVGEELYDVMCMAVSGFMLTQCSAQCDIDCLHAATNAEYGFLLRKKGAAQCNFIAIA